MKQKKGEVKMKIFTFFGGAGDITPTEWSLKTPDGKIVSAKKRGDKFKYSLEGNQIDHLELRKKYSIPEFYIPPPDPVFTQEEFPIFGIKKFQMGTMETEERNGIIFHKVCGSEFQVRKGTFLEVFCPVCGTWDYLVDIPKPAKKEQSFEDWQAEREDRM